MARSSEQNVVGSFDAVAGDVAANFAKATPVTARMKSQRKDSLFRGHNPLLWIFEKFVSRVYFPFRSVDPFAIKRMSKKHPYRLAYTAAARLIEVEAKLNYGFYTVSGNNQQLPIIKKSLPASFESQSHNTKITKEQMQLILYYAKLAVRQLGGSIVEVGSFRGVTTRALAEETEAAVYAIDPFLFYGGDEEDFTLFRTNTSANPNIIHIRKTSGDACKDFDPGAFCFIFIDATPGFANVKHDATRWGALLMCGGFIAINNVNNKLFPGSRKAAWQMTTEGYDVFGCAHDICVLVKRRRE